MWNWVETRGDHAPEGGAFEGRHDFVAAWITQPTAREQQPAIQLQHNNHSWWKPWYNEIYRGNGTRPYGKRLDIGPELCYQDLVSLGRRQSGELYNIFKLSRQQCDSRLGPYGAQSNMVSQRDGDR